MHVRSCPLLSLLLLFISSPVLAQSPAQRALLTGLEDSLAGISDSVPLLEGESRLIQQAKRERDDPMIHLRLGLYAYRLGELADDAGHFDNAAGEFEWATELARDWPWPWYGVGRAESALIEHPLQSVVGLRNVLDLDEVNKAANAYERALQNDPAFAPALYGLADAAIREQGTAHLQAALAELRRAASGPAARQPRFQRARGRVERETVNRDSALAAFRRYLKAGGDSGVGLLEVARSLFDLGREDEARSAYREATLHLGSPAAVALMRSDIAWIATDEELADYDHLSTMEHPEWLADFWRKRDIRDARGNGERLAEHYRRYFVVIRNFRRPAILYRERDIIYRDHSDQELVDDRGVVYMRHGPPDQIAGFGGAVTGGAYGVASTPTPGVGGSSPTWSPVAGDIPPNQSWKYRRPDRDLILHFRASTGNMDYRLIESVADLFGYEVAHALATGAMDDGGLMHTDTNQAGQIRIAPGPLDGFRPVFESRSGLDPVYDLLAGSPTLGRNHLLAIEREDGQQAIARSTTTDSYVLRFNHTLNGVAQRYALAPNGPGSSRILFVLTASLEDLLTDRGSDAVPLRIRLIATDGTGRAIALDTVRRISLPDTAGEAARLAIWQELAVPPGRYLVTAVLQSPDGAIGRALRWEGVEVPSLGAARVELSDLVLGSRGGLTYMADGREIELNPGNAFTTGDTLQLYYEAGGLTAGERYRTRLEVVRTDRGLLDKLIGQELQPVTLVFEEVAGTGLLRLVREVDLRDAAEGDYRLTLTLESPTGKTLATRISDFRVEDRSSPDPE